MEWKAENEYEKDVRIRVGHLLIALFCLNGICAAFPGSIS
jgi:hypothetical protein